MVSLSFNTPMLHFDGPDTSSEELLLVELSPKKRRHRDCAGEFSFSVDMFGAG